MNSQEPTLETLNEIKSMENMTSLELVSKLTELLPNIKDAYKIISAEHKKCIDYARDKKAPLSWSEEDRLEWISELFHHTILIIKLLEHPPTDKE